LPNVSQRKLSSLAESLISMRLFLEILLGFALCLLLAAALMAQEPADPGVRRAQLAAANANAIDALRREVYTVPLSRGVTVRDLVEKTGSQTDLNQILSRAEQIGGPRWLEGPTCQVRLEISGQRIAPVLIQMANIAHERTPIRTAELQTHLDDFSRRTFSATGTSTGIATAESIVPTAQNAAWVNVPQDMRREAISAARRDAVARVMESLRPIEISPRHTIGTELDEPNSPVKQALNSYFNGPRPITSVQFREDRQVEVTLGIPPGEVFDVIHGALSQPNQIGATLTANDWRNLHEQIVRRMANPVGMAQLSTSNGQPALTSPRVAIPQRAPAWTDQQITAEGTAPRDPNPLKARNQATINALRKLQLQLDTYRLTPELTIAQAAHQDDRIALALDRTLNRLQAYKYDVHPDGSVTASVSLQLSDVWNELHNLP